MEIRSFAAAPSLTGRTISGYAVVFNSESQVMFDPKAGRMFIEIIEPQAITKDIILDSDIKMLLEHNKERLLARCNKGKGTLDTFIDTKGVRYRFNSPNTQDGDFAVEMIKRGDISGSSFAFTIAKNGDKWEKRKDGIWLRRVKRARKLYDFTITADPAYQQTTAEVRKFLTKLTDEERAREMAYYYRKAGMKMPKRTMTLDEAVKIINDIDKKLSTIKF